METKKPSELLECAANLIEEKGLARGVYLSVSGACCTYGAMGLCEEGYAGWLPYSDEVLRTYYLPLLPKSVLTLSNRVNKVMEYNDRPNTKKSTIVNKLRKAAKIARKAGE